MAFIQGTMQGQPMPAAEIERQAKALGFSHGTLEDAKHRLRVHSERQGKIWVWIPPKTRTKRAAVV
jgi:hypothetical protein